MCSGFCMLECTPLLLGKALARERPKASPEEGFDVRTRSCLRSSRMNMRIKLTSSNPQQTQMARMSVNSVTRLPRPAPAAKT